MSKWKVSSQFFNDVAEYQVFRIINAEKTNHLGNREYTGVVYTDKKAAQRAADELNGRG